MRENETRKRKHPKLVKGIQMGVFGLATTIATAGLTYFVAPNSSSSGNSGKVNANDPINEPMTHGEKLFSNLTSGISGLKLQGFTAQVVLPDNDSSTDTNNKISVTGDVSLKMPSLDELALNIDSTITYSGYYDENITKDVKKDLDVTYLGSSKNLYLSLTDGYDKNVEHDGKTYKSGIRYCVSGTEYDDLFDTVVTMLLESENYRDVVYKQAGSSSDSDSSSSSLASLTKTMTMSIEETSDYVYAFTIDLGKEAEGWEPIVLNMSSDEDCNLTGVWTTDPIVIPLGSGEDQIVSISLDAKNVSTTEEINIATPDDSNYSHLVNSTSLMRNIFNIVDKRAFNLGISGDFRHKYDTDSEGKNVYETLSLVAKMDVDYPSNKLDFSPSISSVIDGKNYSYGMNLALRPIEENSSKSNLYFDYLANDVATGKLNFTSILSLDKFLGSMVDSFGKASNNVDLDKITAVINRLTSLVSGTKEIITGNVDRKGEGEPASDLGIDGDTYLDTLTNRTYTKKDGEWVKDKMTIIDEIKEGHYQHCFDILKNVYTGDNIIFVTLTLKPFGLGDDSEIVLALDSTTTSSNLLSIKLNDLEFSDFALDNFVIAVNSLGTSVFEEIDAAKYQNVNNIPSLFDELASIANEKTALLSLSGKFSNEIPSYDKGLSSFEFSGSAVFNANEGEKNAKVALTMDQNYANASSKNVKHDLRLEMDTDADSKASVLFAYQSKDVEESKSDVEKGGLYGKGYASNLMDLYDYMRSLYSDEKTTLRERIVNPIRNLTTIINLQAANKEAEASEPTTYFSFLKTSYISKIESVTEDGAEKLNIHVNGAAFDLADDIVVSFVRYAANNETHLAGELKSLDVAIALNDKQSLSLSLGVDKLAKADYEEGAEKVASCPKTRMVDGKQQDIPYYDFSTLAALAKFGINTGLKQSSYYWKGNIAVALSQLNGIIDVTAEIYIKVSGSSFKMMGSFNVPLIPGVNGPTDKVNGVIGALTLVGERKVDFYYDANTDYKTNSSSSRLYFEGSSDVKGTVFDTKDYASFSLDYAINHAEDVFLGYVLDVYPSLLKKDEASNATTPTSYSGSGAPTTITDVKAGDTYLDNDTGYTYTYNEDGSWVKNSSTDITLDNEYDSLISGYESDGKTNWNVTFDAAALLGVMNVTTDNFVFNMNARHVATVSLGIKGNGDVLTNVSLDLKVYLGINAKISFNLENVDPTLNDEKTRYESVDANAKFDGDESEFYSYVKAHKNDAENTVYSYTGKNDTTFKEDNSWKISA